MVDLKVGRYYLIRSRYAKEIGKERTVAKFIGMAEGMIGWETSFTNWYHDYGGRGKLGYCMWDSDAEVIREVPEDEVFLWQI